MINNTLLVTQKIDFGSLRWGSIAPTDVDLKIDFNGHLVEIEAKQTGKELLWSQKYGMENQIKARSSDYKYLGIVVEHDFIEPNHPILIDECRIVQFISTDSNGWKTTKQYTVKELIDAWKEKHQIKGLGG